MTGADKFSDLPESNFRNHNAIRTNEMIQKVLLYNALGQ